MNQLVWRKPASCWLASVLVHEVMHNRGYSHHDTLRDSSAARSWEYAHCVNDQASGCAHRMLRADIPDGVTGLRRSAGVGEAELAPVGGGGGTPFRLECFDGRAVDGLDLRAGARIDALGLSCRSLGVLKINESQGLVGAVGSGLPATQRCPAGEVAVGARGFANDRLVGLGLRCARESDVYAYSTASHDLPASGGTDGLAWSRQCPPGMALAGIRGRADSTGGIQRARLVCRSLPWPAARARVLARVGAGTGTRDEIELCPGDSAIVGLDATAGADLNRLAGHCMPTRTICGVDGCRLSRWNVDGGPGLIAGHGSWDGTFSGGHACGGGDVMVGLQIVEAGGRVDGVRGVCANLGDWTRRNAPPPPTALAGAGMIGSSTGELRTLMCPMRQVLAGWTIGTTGLVASLQPQCRPMAPLECWAGGGCTYTLEVVRAGSGGGTVTSDVGAISCGTYCSQLFSARTVVTLTATPAANSRFDRWEGCAAVTSDGRCQVEMGSVLLGVVTAYFSEVPKAPSCYQSCFAACLAEGFRAAQCRPMCLAECSSYE